MSSSSSSSSSEATVTVADRPADAPLLVSFPQGVPARAADMKFSVLKAKDQAKDKGRLVVKTSNGSVQYRGTNFGENSSRKNCHQMAVAVLNAKNELVLYPCSHAFTLRPQVTQSATAAAARPAVTNATRKETLTNEFGSKKKKRALQAAKSNTISAENISGATELEGNLFAGAGEAEAKSDLIEAAEKIVQKSKKRARG